MALIVAVNIHVILCTSESTELMDSWELQMTTLYFFGKSGKSIKGQSKHDTYIRILQSMANLSNSLNKQNKSASRN